MREADEQQRVVRWCRRGRATSAIVDDRRCRVRPSPRSRRAGRRRTGRTPRRTRRAGSTSAPPPARAAGGGGPARTAGTAAGRSTSSATNMVSRSLAAGKSSMPPTANSGQREDLGVVNAGRGGLASCRCRAPPRPARRTSRPVAVRARVEPALGEGAARARMPASRIVPCRNSAARRRRPRPSRASRAFGCRPAGREPRPRRTRRQGRPAQRTSGLSSGLAGQERLDQHADHGHAEDDQHRATAGRTRSCGACDLRGRPGRASPQALDGSCAPSRPRPGRGSFCWTGHGVSTAGLTTSVYAASGRRRARAAARSAAPPRRVRATLRSRHPLRPGLHRAGHRPLVEHTARRARRGRCRWWRRSPPPGSARTCRPGPGTR